MSGMITCASRASGPICAIALAPGCGSAAGRGGDAARQPNLEGAGEIPLRRLVKEALRIRPSRIVVVEVRQKECSDLSQSA